MKEEKMKKEKKCEQGEVRIIYWSGWYDFEHLLQEYIKLNVHGLALFLGEVHPHKVLNFSDCG